MSRTFGQYCGLAKALEMVELERIAVAAGLALTGAVYRLDYYSTAELATSSTSRCAAGPVASPHAAARSSRPRRGWGSESPYRIGKRVQWRTTRARTSI